MLKLSSPVFQIGTRIPPRHTGDAENISPPLRWSGVPEQTREFALICEDPDAPRTEPFVHWVIYNISPNISALPEGLGQLERLELPVRADQGRNSWERVGYEGPLPPLGHGQHRYFFRLYALNAELGLPPGATVEELKKAMRGHVIDTGELMGTYERSERGARAHRKTA